MVATHKSANKYISDNNKCENPTYCNIHHVIIINIIIYFQFLKKYKIKNIEYITFTFITFAPA